MLYNKLDEKSKFHIFFTNFSGKIVVFNEYCCSRVRTAVMYKRLRKLQHCVDRSVLENTKNWLKIRKISLFIIVISLQLYNSIWRSLNATWTSMNKSYIIVEKSLQCAANETEQWDLHRKSVSWLYLFITIYTVGPEKYILNRISSVHARKFCIRLWISFYLPYCRIFFFFFCQ